VVSEPLGGAHRDPLGVMKRAADMIEKDIDELSELDSDTLIRQRRQKFLDMGSKGLS